MTRKRSGMTGRSSGAVGGKPEKLSESSEMYLQVIWRLTEREREVSVSDIAKAMGHSLSTVSEKIVRLTEGGLLRHEWREGVSMTPKGRQAACRTIRKRRLLETFLFKMAGYGIHELHEEACRLEHVISERLSDALDRLLGYPMHDPHGHPIPARDGSFRPELLEPLSEVDEGRTVRIAQLRSADPEVLEYTARLGLLPGRSCTVMQKAPFQGPLTIADGSERIAIAFEIASIIDVQAEPGERFDEAGGANGSGPPARQSAAQ
ncbi:metal-dependent transcriptional regulator [Chlorobaculum sp. 24CR]|uniref:metal-dependent transcriptional regulator n=1 Tax=Chlorobaculum sp. 24CR TaxID=2508878 RepID=UPI001FD6E798|nr:metal-dependent transcriptional regulator [Chlorobaculum sp. 24CR]